MRLFGGKIGFVGSGIHSLSSQILSKSFRNWFENRTLRGTKKGEKFASLLFYAITLVKRIAKFLLLKVLWLSRYLPSTSLLHILHRQPDEFHLFVFGKFAAYGLELFFQNMLLVSLGIALHLSHKSRTVYVV